MIRISGQSGPKRVVELREKPLAIDRRLGQIVGDGEARPRVERHLVGTRQVQRPEADRRDRVAAGLDHRPHVPVAADQEGGQAQHPGRGQAPPPAAEDDHAEADRDDRDQEGELDRGGEAGGDPGDDQRPLVEQWRVALGRVLDRPRIRRPALVGVDQEGDEGDQEGEAHDVVSPLAGLGFDHHPRVEHDRAAATSVAGPTL